jgi:site-specific recombinase XerD
VRYPPHPLTRAQARRLLALAADGTRIGLRNRAHLTVLYRTGLRCKESCMMKLSDVYPIEDGCALVRVEMPKGYARGVMPREVGIDSYYAAYLFEWITERGQDQGPLFPSKTGRNLHPSYLRQLIPRLGAKAGMERRVHAHAFRHTFARELYDEGVGMMEIMLALGHASLGTTQAYLQSIGATEVVRQTSRRNHDG